MSSDDGDRLEGGEVIPAGETPAGDVPAGDPLGEMLGGGLDLGAMMQMASEMQTQVAASQEALASAEVVGTAGGGAVSVTLNGHLHLMGVHIDPSAIDPDDLTMLEDLIRAAWQAAHDQVAQLQAEADPLGGMGDLGGLGGLLGGG